MSIRVAINHVTEYKYDREVTLSPQIVRLRPAPHVRTPVHSFSMKIQPGEHFLNWQQDPYGNYLARLVFPEKTRLFRTQIDLIVEMTTINPFDFFLEPDTEQCPFEYDEASRQDLLPYLKAAPMGPKFWALLDSIPREKMDTNDFLVLVNRMVYERIGYTIRMEPGVQTPEETLTKKTGSCRDSGWLLVNLFRHLGIAARFVSGYLIQLKSDQKSLDGPSGPEADFTDLHAWTEVYLPGAGWVGLDPTSGLLTAEGHVPLAATPEPISAAPITGAVDKCEVAFGHSMSVVRVHEDPRTTLPYTGGQWKAIDELGRQIDEKLMAGDVRLTMGGEPTFISIDDMDGEEWNTAALGEEKLRRADILFDRMRDRFAPGGLKYYGMGKWYPGEPLPRWVMGCWWRTDGEPVWLDDKLFARTGGDYGHTDAEAGKFIERLAENLEVDPAHVMAGYEDMFYYLWKDRKLPVNIDPHTFDWKDTDERKRLARLLEKDLGAITGFVLPLSKGQHGYGQKWRSGAWPFEAGSLFLIPGDSPMGFRLPLDSLPWTGEKAADIEEFDPSAPRGELPLRTGLRAPVMHAGGLGGSLMEQKSPGKEHVEQHLRDNKPDHSLIHTALCIEPREGMLHAFLPPVRFAEDYLDLIATIEKTAGQLDMPIRIEGYAPPHDPRLNHFKITPDPGVIEVNIQPAGNWREAVEITTDLYEDARQARLGTEKFMLDGRHTGTGGGNHIVVGGPSPLDSPFLRRPDLLKSLLTYWHNHPSLSYLFSGLFIGPTSQAPRADEGRYDSLHELELAMRQIQPGISVEPWLVDRLFRNLLVDVTGNTHRAEICIDKLYSPDSSSGRLGLVEVRSYEMPPHPQMSLAQQLLLRGLIARFWEKPFEQTLVRWGTLLHDRFMLPEYIWQDFSGIIDDFQALGYPFQSDWYRPHFEFRYPVVGTIRKRGLEVELRTATEPWNVLGEESAGGGTARYVDSSLERLQVKVRGMTDSRHVVTCNGHTLPLTSTGVREEYVAGVRYRAWQPPSCLHPTIGSHAPLTFDIVDSWNDLAIAGCTYHVAHPGGRSYETFPVNALEAEARRHTRFQAHGHTPRPVKAAPPRINPEFPHTLDLRWT